MHYIVYCIDFDGMVDIRLQSYDRHKEYLKSCPLITLISGPLTADDCVTMIGSFFLYEADEVRSVENFVKDDPFNKAGIWKTIDIKPFLKRIDNRP